MTEPNMECGRCGKPYISEDAMVCPCHPIFNGDFSGGGSFSIYDLPGVKEAISQAEQRGYEKGAAEERRRICRPRRMG